MNFISEKAFTLIEIIIVLSILMIIGTAGLTTLSTFRKSAELSSAADTILTYIIQARSKTLSAENGIQYGVHFESLKIVFYQGTPYSSQNSLNQEIVLSGDEYGVP